MPSTDPIRMLEPLLEALRGQGLKSNDAVQQASLLAAWAWCYRYRPELNLPNPERRPGITAAMQAMRTALEETGGFPTINPDFLEMNCTGRTVQDMQGMVATMDWLNTESVVKALANLAEQAMGQQSGQLQLPLELAKLMVQLGKTNGKQVLAAYPMSDLPMALADGAAERTYASTSHSALSDALVLISGASLATEASSADVVLSVPPVGAKVSGINAAGKRRSRRSEAVGLQEAWEGSTDRAVVLMLAGTLFDMAEYELRESLVRENAIDMVIQLPGQTLLGTSTPPVLIVLNHQRDQGAPITFVDASRLVADSARLRSKPAHHNQELWDALSQLVMNSPTGPACRLVSQGEIASNDFDLSVNRYVMGDATQKMAGLDNARPLQNVAEIVRAQTLKSEEEGGTLFIEIGGRDIDTNGQIRIEEPPKELHVAGRTRKRAEQQQLRPGDVLLISKGSIGRVALVGSECGDNWVAGQVFLILRTQERGLMKPEYLYRYLASPMVQQYLEEISSGAGIPILKANDIKNLPVPVPSPEEQKRVLDVHQQIMDEYDAIRAHQARIEELTQMHWAI